MARKVLLLVIGADPLPSVTPIIPVTTTDTVDPWTAPVVTAPSALTLALTVDAVAMTWTPPANARPLLTYTVQSAPDVSGAPGAWADTHTRLRDPRITLALTAGPRWVRVRSELSGRTSPYTAAVFADPATLAQLQAATAAAQADINQEIIDRAAALSAEASARSTADLAVAQDAADALLSEQLTREAAITTEQTIRQSADDSLAQSISTLAAGTGEQFDSRKVWYFDTDLESWTGNGTPTVASGYLRPANHATDPFVLSATGLAINGDSYKYAKARIKRTGAPVWAGQLSGYDTGGAIIGGFPTATIPEPTFDADGDATVDWKDIPWSGTVDRIRLDLSSNQSATDYFEIDWVAVGRPTPGASVAALQEEATARVTADAAEATQRTTLATQMRGAYTGTDVAAVTSGLVYSERLARATADSAMASDITGLAVTVNDPVTGVAANASAVSAMEVRVGATEAGVASYYAAYTMTLDVNGKISGFKSVNDGAVSLFEVQADIFKVGKQDGGDALTWEGGVLSALKGSYSVKIGAGFGSSSNLVFWYGADGSTATRTIANAKVAITSSGNYKLGSTQLNYGSGWSSGAAITYSASAGSPATATISVASGVFRFGDQQISYNAGSVNVTGTNGTTVKYFLYYDDPGLAGGSQTLIASASVVDTFNSDGRVLIGTLAVTYPTSGGGSGGGGPTCPQVDMWVITPNGPIKAGDVRVGEMLLLCDPVTREETWGEVTYSARTQSEGVRLTGDAVAVLECSTTAPIPTDHGYLLAPGMQGRSTLSRNTRGIDTQRIATVEPLGAIDVQHISVGDRCFWTGADPDSLLLHHNLKAELPP